MGRKVGVLATAGVMAVTCTRLISYVLREAHLRYRRATCVMKTRKSPQLLMYGPKKLDNRRA